MGHTAAQVHGQPKLNVYSNIQFLMRRHRMPQRNFHSILKAPKKRPCSHFVPSCSKIYIVGRFGSGVYFDNAYVSDAGETGSVTHYTHSLIAHASDMCAIHCMLHKINVMDSSQDFWQHACHQSTFCIIARHRSDFVWGHCLRHH